MRSSALRAKPRPAAATLRTAVATAVALATVLVLALLPATAGAKLIMFSAPSHNIGCAMDTGFARCDVARRTWRTPAKPRGCMLDWGNGFFVERRGRGRVVCAGDTTLNPRGAVLAYGKSRSVGRFTCTSRRAGMTCSHSGSGHGFTVSRSAYRVF